MFKNLFIYQLPSQSEFQIDLDQLVIAMEHNHFIDMNSDGFGKDGVNAEQRESTGWVSPVGDDYALSLVSHGHALIRMAHQVIDLPSDVVKDELKKRIKAIEDRESRKVGTREKKAIREQVEFDLLPQAFPRTKYCSAWIDTRHNRLIVDTSSPLVAERLTGLLRKTLGTLPVTPLAFGASAFVTLTQWIKDYQSPKPFYLGYACSLHAPEEQGAVAVFRKHELNTEEVMINLNAGKVVSSLELSWAEKLEFSLELGTNILVKRIKCLGIYNDLLGQQTPETLLEQLDGEFALMIGELSLLIQDIERELCHG